MMMKTVELLAIKQAIRPEKNQVKSTVKCSYQHFSHTAIFE